MPTDPTPSPGTRPGGRTARTREAVVRATAEILIESGPAELTWEGLAARSGVNRSTIYRRWGTLAAVVAEVAADVANALAYPETGSLEDDLAHAITQIGDALTPTGRRLVQALVGWRDDAVQQVMAAFWASRRAAIAAILRRHGSPVDPAVLVRVMAGPLYYSALVEDRSPSPEDIDAAISTTSAWLHDHHRRTS